VTRSQPGAAATAARLKELGIEPLISPLIEARSFADARLDLAGVSAIAFTSAHAVVAFAERSPERALRVFAVGDSTADAARAQRFTNVLSARGDMAALASALATRRRELTGPILYPAAAEPAHDLAGALDAVGLQVRQVTIYETVVIPPSPEVGERLADIDAVVVHSARAAKALAAYVKVSPTPKLVAYCLSAQIGRSLTRAGLAAIISAAAPNEAALMAEIAAPSD
jgi:uroporphyrinogen-III synthase